MKNPLAASTLPEYFFFIDQSKQLSDAFHAELVGTEDSFDLKKIELGTFVVNNIPEGKYCLKIYEGSQINDSVYLNVKNTKSFIPSLLTEKGRYAVQHAHLRLLSFGLTIREEGGFSMEKSEVILKHLKEDFVFRLNGANSYRIECFPQGLYEIRISDGDRLQFTDTLNLHELFVKRRQLTITVGSPGDEYFHQKGLIQPYALRPDKLALTFNTNDQKGVWELCKQLRLPVPTYDKFKPMAIEKSKSCTILDLKNQTPKAKADVIRQLKESQLFSNVGLVIGFNDAKNIDYLLTNEILVGWNPDSSEILAEFARKYNLTISVVGSHIYKLQVPSELSYNILTIADSIRKMTEYVEYVEPVTYRFQ